MRPSEYNLEIDIGEHILLVNLLSRSVLELDRTSYQLFNNLKYSKLEHFEESDIEQFWNLLIEARFICEDNFDEFSYLSDRVNQARFDRRELAVVISPTMGCNFNCHYCFENRTDEWISDDIEDRLISHVEQNLPGRSALAVQWFGGEPLRAIGHIERISKRLMQLAEQHDVGYAAAMVTNGYFLSRDIASSLSSLGVHTVQITLDGDKHMHDRIRKSGHNSSFETILANIKSASSYLDIKLRIHIAPYNLSSTKNLLQDLAAREIGEHVSEIYFSRLFNYKHDSNNNQFLPDKKKFYTARDFALILSDLSEKCIQLGLPLSDPLAVQFSVCTAVRENTVVIGPSGNLYKCYFELDNPDHTIGNLETGIVPSEHLDQWLDHKIARDAECRRCKFLPVCFGGCTHKWHKGAPKEVICTHLKYNAPRMFELFYAARR